MPGQETHERHLLLGSSAQFRHDADAVATVLGELVLHFESTYGVNLVAEEVDAERQFRTERIDIEDASTHGELSGLIHIVHFLESETAQCALYLHEVHDLSRRQRERALIEPLLRHHKFAQSFGACHHIERHACAPTLLP